MAQGATDTCYRMKVDAFRREIDRRMRLSSALPAVDARTGRHWR
jgi:hypothetical protein